MAIGRGGKLDLAEAQCDDSVYLSDESEFYGDEATIHELEVRAGAFNAAAWWASKIPSLNEIASTNMSTAMEKKEATLYNPYEGRWRCARQLGETVEDFLQRLPPATTQFSMITPWIFIANPYRKAPTRSQEENVEGGVTDEGPPEEDSDWAQFVMLAGNLLEELTGIRHDIEKKNAGQAKASITRVVNIEKEKIVRKILDTATELHCTSGKWMMFCPPNEVNPVWSVVARATAGNDLGIAAKVAPDGGSGRDRLICIYTKDFNDLEDVTRVARKMKDLGLIDARERSIYYKCDAYTYLGLNRDNEHAIKVSLYSSGDVLAGKVEQPQNQKLDGSFYKKREDSGDWRQLEQQ